MNQPVNDPRQAECFTFSSCEYDHRSGTVRLSYRFDDGPELVERIHFPHAPWPTEASRQAAFERALGILHCIAGVSYYKAGLSPQIRLPGRRLSAGLSDFLTELYVQGLGELAYVNQVDVAGRIRFRASSDETIEPTPLMLPERALVAMGGGKDSLVGLDLMRRAGVEVLPVCVGGARLIRDTVKLTGLPLLVIDRELAPGLAEMNRAGAWNGHVPVTAINSAILLCAAILYGFRHVVFANERSADEATLITRDGAEVNHQYSKSSSFESALRTLIASEVSKEIEYFSVIRPWSELGVVQRFSELKKYHGTYSSCNRNFHLDGPRVEGRWCRDCPKCRFAALSLALFMAPAEVTAILGGDMLDDPTQMDGFRALCALGSDKPFECVGEAGESRAALAALATRPEWREHRVVRLLSPELCRVQVPSLGMMLEPGDRHFYPESLANALESAGICRV